MFFKFVVLFLLLEIISASSEDHVLFYNDFRGAAANLSLDGNSTAVTPDGLLRLTNSKQQIGHAFYVNPFRFKNPSADGNSTAVNSFSTTFVFGIIPDDVSGILSGNGMSFVLSPSREIPGALSGQYLGLFNLSTNGNSSNHIVAVELDTIQNSEFEDIDDNHVGIDVNSLKSVSSAPATYFTNGVRKNVSLSSGDPLQLWVEYDGLKKQFNVTLAPINAPKPDVALLSLSLDLSTTILESMYVGFSSATQSSRTSHYILGWSFMINGEAQPLDLSLLPKLPKVPKPPNPSNVKSKMLKIGLAVVLPVLVVLLVISLWFLCYYRHRSKKNIEDHNLLMVLKRLPGTPREFNFKDLNKATNNFNENMKLGQGGFGVVYKGVLLVGDENTQLVAVKKFSRESNKGIADFIAELTIINRLRHKHLVPLIGWCHKKGRLLLVYEYMPNGSLDNHLFGGLEKILSWEHRYKIIYGVASALHYLHNDYDQKVVHRDLKASNIMLDSDFNARLGDFGLARAIENERTSYAELEGVPGTVGYIAPECLHTGKATRQSDVFGFGAVILEVVCGQRPWTRIAGFTYLVDWVWKLYREGRILEALDVRLGNDYLLEQVERLLLLGLACSHPIASERPRTETIVQIISGSAPTPIVPHFKPAFVWPTALDTLEEEEENISIRTPEILSQGR